MYRYAEGDGTAARFDDIADIDFLSSTELICTDRWNHCLRHVDLSLSPPTTSTFAGSCTVYGVADGHRLNSALFGHPTYTEVNSNKSILYVLDGYQILRRIDLTTDNVTTLVTFDTSSSDMKFFSDSLLYLTENSRVIVFNLSSGEERVVAGGERGSAIGSFECTKFDEVYGLLTLRDEVKTILLVADYNNNRFAGSSCKMKI